MIAGTGALGFSIVTVIASMRENVSRAAAAIDSARASMILKRRPVAIALTISVSRP